MHGNATEMLSIFMGAQDNGAALSAAIRGGRLDVVSALLELGVDVNGGEPGRPQGEAKERDLVQLKALPGEAGVSTNRYPLFLACATGRLDMVALLVAHGASLATVPDRREPSFVLQLLNWSLGPELAVRLPFEKAGLHVIHQAARHGHLDVARYLVEKGADVHAVTKSGRTALHLAAYSGDHRLVEYLVDLGVNVRAKDKHGETALHMAAAAGKLDTLAYLAGRGLRSREKDKHGVTALHLAAYSGNLELVQWLLQRGLDLHARDKLGRTALHLAAVAGNKEMLVHLEQAGLSLDDADKAGRTPFHLAAYSGSLELLEYLVERWVYIRARDKEGNNALAFVRGNANVATFLGRWLTMAREDRVTRVRTYKLTVPYTVVTDETDDEETA
eukprot:jgi/Mesvir1/24867/Mv22100-RA.1